MDAAALDLRYKQFEFTIAYQRIPTHQGDVERPEFVQDGEHSRYEFVSLEIGELAELFRSSQMGRQRRSSPGTVADTPS